MMLLFYLCISESRTSILKIHFEMKDIKKFSYENLKRQNFLLELTAVILSDFLPWFLQKIVSKGSEKVIDSKTQKDRIFYSN